MAKGDDAIRRKKNEVNRKKIQKDSSKVSARIADLIAAKKRRKSGKRRICEGMCFTLPTPDDPFNDRFEKKNLQPKERKKLVSSPVDGKLVTDEKRSSNKNQRKSEDQEQKIPNSKNENEKSLIKSSDNIGCPSKFLLMCLKTIQNALQNDGMLNNEEDKSLYVNTWGVEFWKSFSLGVDILETSGNYSTVEQIAWIISTAADSITRIEKDGLSLANPSLLFLVPTQEKAIKIRSVCKPLKALGIHMVSLHPGASLDHQIYGLKSCEPEFVVSTPERLLDLISLKAINISAISSLVIDGLESLYKAGYHDTIKSIRQSISGNPHTTVFNDSSTYGCLKMVQNLLPRSICRLSLNDSFISQSSCITQSICVCTSEEEKFSKGIQVLDDICSNHLRPQLSKVMFMVGNERKCVRLSTAIKLKGYSISANSSFNNSEVKDRNMTVGVSVIDINHMNEADLGEFQVIIISDFVLTIDTYVHILTRMARHSVNGVLHSYFTEKDSSLANSLIDILQQCGQIVPESLRNLSCNVSSMSE